MSDDVTQFLQQVQQLQGSRTDTGDASSKELEKKILQEKSERAARRAGTLSPLKAAGWSEASPFDFLSP